MRFSTRLLFASLLGLAGLATHVDAHAKLVYPTAWNPQPSKSNTCGVAATVAAANPQSFKSTMLGSSVEIQWTVVVGDGKGPITAKLDTNAKPNPTATDFTVNLPVLAGQTNLQPTVAPYKVIFTIPAGTKCNGPENTCTMRVASSSNWVACATIKLESQQQVATTPPVVTQAPPVVTQAPVTQAPVTQAPVTKAPTQPATPTNGGTVTQKPTTPVVTQAPVTQAPATVAPVTAAPTRDPKEYYPYASSLNNCQIPTIADNLEICTNMIGQNVQLMGTSLANIESQVREQIDFNMNNPAVLERPNTVGCRQALTDMICAQMFPPCRSDAIVVCTSTCQRVNTLCKPNATEIIDETGGTSNHAALFDCSNVKLGFTELTRDSNGVCPAVATGDRPVVPDTTEAPGTQDPITTQTPGTTQKPGTTQAPVNLSTGSNQASSLSSSTTVVMGVVTALVAFVARI